MFGFQQETFRSHKFEGDIEAALVEVSAQFIKLLYDMGYTEKASAYCSALLDISTSKSDKVLHRIIRFERDMISFSISPCYWPVMSYLGTTLFMINKTIHLNSPERLPDMVQ